MVDYMEIIYWCIFAALMIGEFLVAKVYKLPKKHVIRDWVEPAYEAIIIATILRIFVIQSFAIPTGSMEDSLMIGDHPMAFKFVYGLYNPLQDRLIFDFVKPQRGDVIIFRDPTGKTNEMWIKRCMAVPGDTIEMKDKVFYLNGKKLDEPYVVHKDPNLYPFPDQIMKNIPASITPQMMFQFFYANRIIARDNFPKMTVPPGYIFAMGDNRDNSYDSRFWGFLPYKKLRGKAFCVYWPFNRIKLIKHYKIN